LNARSKYQNVQQMKIVKICIVCFYFSWQKLL